MVGRISLVYNETFLRPILTQMEVRLNEASKLSVKQDGKEAVYHIQQLGNGIRIYVGEKINAYPQASTLMRFVSLCTGVGFFPNSR